MANYSIVTDIDRCVGCHACTVACKAINDVPVGRFWNRVLRVGPTPKVGGSGQYPDVEMYFLNVSCQHCADPECIKVCPTGASFKAEDGTVQVQVSGSSIPEPAVEGVEFADGILTVTMAQHEEGTPATMDFVLHQFVLSAGAAPEVAGVVLVRGDDGAELPAGELVELEEAE